MPRETNPFKTTKIINPQKQNTIMSKIESIKQYEGNVLDTIFFRPMLTGPSAEQMGLKVLYNMPTPTTLHFWRRSGDILNKFVTGGWNGGTPAAKYQKKIELNRVKAEMAYGADDYFSTVYELITSRPDVNFENLSGTELEEAETALFRASIAESIRSTMWYGLTTRPNGRLTTFDGLVKRILSDTNIGSSTAITKYFGYFKDDSNPQWAEKLLKDLWEKSSAELKSLRSEGQLAFFVTTDVYNAYEEALDNVAHEAAYLAKQNGREGLYYRGIPLVDVQLDAYHDNVRDLPHSFAILTDRRNLALAVNTNDFPGTEVRMWYNPDMMENRQRAVFMAGCDYLLPELITVAVGVPVKNITYTLDGGVLQMNMDNRPDSFALDSIEILTYNDEGELELDCETLTINSDKSTIQMQGVTSVSSYVLRFYYNAGIVVDVAFEG